MDMSLLYPFEPASGEPIAAKPYPGNMLDQTVIRNFIGEYKIERGFLIFDKGFWNDDLFKAIDQKEGLAYLIPLNRNSKLISRYAMDEPTQVLEGYQDGTILYKKVKIDNGKFLYSFRDPKLAFEQEVGYVQHSRAKTSSTASSTPRRRVCSG